MKLLNIMPLAAAAVISFATGASAHTPLCSCYDNGDGSVMCEGGFSDGSSASGVALIIRDQAGKTVLEGKMDENSEYEFKKPDGAYSVLFDAGAGHRIEISSQDITE